MSDRAYCLLPMKHLVRESNPGRQGENLVS